MAELSFRSRKILYAMITEYIAQGEPVGSRTLARRYGINLSPATIRNVLADLEDEGFLVSPHTSAGRIPTDKGFRVFVDALIQTTDVSAEDRAAVLARLQSLRPGIDDVLKETGKLLSSMTGAASLVLAPKPEDEELAQLRFLPLREQELLAVVVTRSGVVQNRVVRVARPVSAGELEQVHNYLSTLIADRSLSEVRETLAEEVAGERTKVDQLQRRVKQMVDALAIGDDAHAAMHIEGQGLLLDRPEFADVEKMRSVLRTFEERERLLELLDRTLSAGGVQIFIGTETNLPQVQDLSVVSASYGQSGFGAGTIGVIGPTRMDYSKVVPLVGFTAQVVGGILAGKRPDEPSDS